jgi:hypothetical protein
MSLSAVAAEEQAIQEDMEGVQDNDDAMQQDQPAGSESESAIQVSPKLGLCWRKRTSRTLL